jgi:Viral BACON domain
MHRRAYISLFLLIFSFILVPSVFAEDPGNPDTVRVASIQIDPGPSPIVFSIPVTLYNDEEIHAASLGIYYDSDDITIDSVSLLGGTAEACIPQSQINPTLQYGLIGFVYYPTPAFRPVIPGDSLLATLWFTLAANAPDQVITLDSGFVAPAGNFVLTASTGISLEPQFIAGEITVGEGIPPLPEIHLSPGSFAFDGVVGEPNPANKVLNITNTGEGVLMWTATWNSSWLEMFPVSGMAPSNPSVGVDISGLTAGVYYDTITVSDPAATNNPQIVPVILTIINPAPEIELIPDNFYFVAMQDSANPDNQSMQINDIGGGTLAWTATNTSGWLTLSSYSGSPGETIDLMVDITGMTFGYYIDTIVVSDPEASNSPQYAEVVLELVSSFPVLEVSPDSLVIAAPSSTSPTDRILEIINDGGGTLEFEVTSQQLWLSFTPQTGSTGSVQEVAVTVASAGMMPGFHYDTITVVSSNGSGSPKTIPVFLWVMDNPPDLQVSPSQLDFVGFECANIPSIPVQNIIISNGGVEDLDWTATWNSAWLNVTPSSGDNAETLDVEVDETGLAVGTYEDTVLIDAVWNIGTSQSVVVTFTVEEQTATPELVVNRDYVEFIFLAGYVGVASYPNLEISNAISGCIDWYITDPYPWLEFLPSSGSKPMQVFTIANGGGLPLGITSGQFVVHSPGSVNDSVVVEFDLFIAQLGDANCSGDLNVSDAVHIINYIFVSGEPPIPRIWAGDANCDHICNVEDAVSLINYIFVGGAPPCQYLPIIYPEF